MPAALNAKAFSSRSEHASCLTWVNILSALFPVFLFPSSRLFPGEEREGPSQTVTLSGALPCTLFFYSYFYTFYFEIRLVFHNFTVLFYGLSLHTHILFTRMEQLSSSQLSARLCQRLSEHIHTAKLHKVFCTFPDFLNLFGLFINLLQSSRTVQDFALSNEKFETLLNLLKQSGRN